MDIRINRPKLPCALLTIIALTCNHANSDSSAPGGTNECAPCTSSAVAYWPMTSETKGSDLSGKNNNATFVGLTYTDGPTGEYKGAVHFSGSNNSFASVTNSQSMNVGKYPGFSFSGFYRLGIQNKSSSLIDWSSGNGYGMFVASSAQNIKLLLYPSHSVVKNKAEFPNMTFSTGSWHFFGISYDKATGIVTAFMDGKQDQEQLEENITVGTAKSSKVGIGTDLSVPESFNYNGDMSCLMLFNVALTADDFEGVRKFCSAQTTAKLSVTDVSREDNKVTIRWQPVIGHYSVIKIKCCRTGTEHCVYYITPNPGDTYATLFVDTDRTYYYYVMIEYRGDVVYTSDPLVAKRVIVAPKMSVIGVNRAGNKVTIRWKQVIGHYTAIKVKYCQIGIEDCEYYNVLNPEDTSATWFVNPDKTFYYFMMIEDDGDVVYTSNPLVANDSNAKTAPDMVAVTVGGSVAGTVTLLATCVILAVVLWKRSRHSREKLNNRVANDTNDNDATRTALAAIKNSPRHNYANIGTASVNHAPSHSARTAKQSRAKPRANMLHVPANESACSDDDDDIDQYDYADTTWQRDASGSHHSPVPASQTSHPTWRQYVSAHQIHFPALQGDHSDPASTASSYQDMQAGGIVSIERHREQELEGTYNDLGIMATQRELQQCTTDSGLGQATWQHNVSCQNLVPRLGADQDDAIDASSNEDRPGQNISMDSSYDDVRIVTQGELAHSTPEGCLNHETGQHEMHELKPYVLCEEQRRQKRLEPEGTYNDVKIVTHDQPGLAVRGLDQARFLTPGHSSDNVASGQHSRYEQLEPVDRHEYLDFKELSQKELTPQL